MKFMTRGLLGLFILTMTIALLATAASVMISALKDDGSAGRDRAAKERVFSVNVLTLKSGEATPIIATFGEVLSGRTLELRAASGGALVQVAPNFREGGVVKKDDLLFQTDPATRSADAQISQTQLDEAVAELEDAEGALILAQDELVAVEHQLKLRQQAIARQKSLLDRGVGTESGMEDAELAASSAQQQILATRQSIANAKARIKRSEIELARSRINNSEAQRELSNTSIYAKFDGVLSDVTSVLGGLVNANERLATLIDPNALEVSFRISSIQYNRLVSNTQNLKDIVVLITADGGDPIPAHIDRVSAAVGEGQTGRVLIAALDAGAVKTLRPGDFVSVSVEEPALQDVAVLPSTAASATGEILLLSDDDRLEEASVDILRKQADEIIISIGQHEGREVITERAPQLGAGIKVEPKRAGQANAQ
ncbi:HlyD family efflux transporter periplasmic adaptor subunit [Amylibacter sp. SFDW26]|uniref:efflux RND transporter periplasmic adaptor subunit n=1 Tax=Amylibacter sp. SFDW26 TaxID=2652722 RepID=UPI00126229CD|nr:HlyD family efflux transporter periplasmic adaptor subunit [Amylibacter sp. SFDW26]KAB7613962.1 HlyD family efflux transporter periplasmic adaptor subunit [Amylibacter sp. SFDW26]